MLSLVAFSFGSVSNPSNAQSKVSSVSAAMLNSGGKVRSRDVPPEIERTKGRLAAQNRS
jgi:hypothetical protein